eukprot:772858-Amphidinium_carterae.1
MKALAEPVIRGDLNISLAISEPQARNGPSFGITERVGVHVAGEALPECTSGFVRNCMQLAKVNGQKKWITGGLTADLLTLAARTGHSDSCAMRSYPFHPDTCPSCKATKRAPSD